MNKARGWRIASRQNKGILYIPPAAVFLALIIAVLTSPQAYALDENKCLVCHGNPDLEKAIASGEKISLYVNEKLANTGAHRYIDCTTCHTTEPHKTDTPLTKLSLAQKCGTCHQYQYKLHLISVHGEQLAQGNRDVATCVDCHSTENNPHSVIRVLEYSAPAYKKTSARPVPGATGMRS